jgi:ABC-2 type transport system permease protein
MKTMVTLVRREFWEHRSLWITPLATAAILIVLAALGGSMDTGPGVQININGQERAFLDQLTPERRSKVFGLIVGGLLLPQLIAMLVVLSIYTLDCLYAERRDRSILFWKSLPVSDGQTVLSKFLTAIAAVPLLVYVVSLVTSVLCLGVLLTRFFGTPFQALAQWDMSTWLHMQAILLADTFVAALWYAPLVAALMLASAWARRSAYMWVTFVPLVAIFVERRSLGTSYIAHFLAYRTGGFFQAIGMSLRHPGASEIASAYERLDATRLLMNPDLWLGLVAAAAILYATVRIRRYRDDT